MAAAYGGFDMGVWIGFSLLVLVLLALDLGLGRGRTIGAREALWRSAGYAALAALFAAGIWHFRGAESALQFTAGYLVELSLSLDNVFVFALVFAHFVVPPALQHRVLFWGIIGALAMRAVMIWAGAALIAEFHWVIYVFGALLVVSGLKMLRAGDAHADLSQNPLVRLFRRHVRTTEGYEGERFLVRRGGLLYATPLLLVLVLVEASDLVFAVDSIPAIFAITTDPFIVWTSNVFAILGLRSLYFALAAVIDRFKYLKYGLALVLVAIGAKMLLADLWKVPTALALAVTAALIGGSIVLSLIATRRKPQLRGVGSG
jgi:tellurite resistance protein TerC